MIVIYPVEKNKEFEKDLPSDWPFMEESEKVLADIPDTWKQYPDTKEGALSIIDMEYRELKKASTPETLTHELIHVASACLHLWRMMHNAE